MRQSRPELVLMDANKNDTFKKETAFPTINLNSIFIMYAIKAKDGQDVGIMDLQGVFLHTSNNEDIIFMKGCLAELMV